MPRFAMLLLAAMVFLAGDDPARLPVTADAAASPCRFTLERNIRPGVAGDAAEVWVLTCHRRDQAVLDDRTVSLRPAAATDDAAGG